LENQQDVLANQRLGAKKMEKQQYSLAKLWPDLSRLWQGDYTSPEGLSAAVVAILFGLVFIFVSLSIINYCRSSARLSFYRKLIKGLTAEQLLDRRHEIRQTASKNPTLGQLWHEFDESLVHIPQKQRLCNTLDAAHFFNAHTIAPGLTENRLLAAVPGFLTAIGVIGTFVGLQLGLGPLGELDPSNAKVDELTHGIFGMIGGASIAFMTSVWGVVTSVFFNFFEKMFERNIRGAISSFQNEVDYLYPRITAEQSLSNIEDFTRQSNERLAELDEKIGHKMQEAMKDASNVISESVAQSLNNILGPAIQSLVDNANSGSERALESLLDRFLQGIGSAGNSQKAMMEQAAQDITAASVGMTTGLNQFASKLDDQIGKMTQKNAEVLGQVNSAIQQQLEAQSQQEQQRQQQLSNGMADFMESMKLQISALAEQNAVTLKTVQAGLSEQMGEQQERDLARQELLQEQILNLHNEQERVTQGIEDVLEFQKQQNSELLSGLRSVIEQFEALSASHQSATASMKVVSSELNAGSNQLGLLSANLKAAIDTFGKQLSDSLAHAGDVTKHNAESARVFKEVVTNLQGAGEQITYASSALNQAAGKAENGLSAVEKHFDSLLTSLETHLEQVQKEVAYLLSDYSERVKDQTVSRLNTWNEQTNSYISSMTDAVRTLSSVVDEIDGKVISRKQGVAV
ncbi:MAG: anti-phage ZorAB system protein ZorA, partial [Enterovibrio sp.]